MAESSLELTSAEKNFYVLCMINTKISPLAVRYLFDSLVPPTDLSNQINRYARKLRDLVSKKVISIEQEDILQRVPGTSLNVGVSLPTTTRKGIPLQHVSRLNRVHFPVQMILSLLAKPAECHVIGKWTTSVDFDVTLMICLLRNFGLVHEPATGWDKLPMDADQSKGADLVRIKIYRNQISHLPTNKIKEVRFNKIFKTLSRAINNLSNDTLSSDVEQIFKFDFDGSSNTALQKIKDDISEWRSENEKTRFRIAECEKSVSKLQKES